MKIKKINKFQYSGYVHDLTVDNTHTYNIDGLAVHNSGGGSLVAYILGITHADPIKYKMQFERFITIGGSGFPDFDLDFAHNDRMKELVIEKFGKNNVALISNYNTLQFKSLIKDLSKLHGIPFEEVNSITEKSIEEATPAAKEKNGILAGAYEPTYAELKEFSPTFNSYLNKYPHINTSVDNLLDSVRNHATHAAGCVLGDDLTKQMPLVMRDGVYQTPWAEGQNVRHLEVVGQIKFDLLGLTTLKIFERCAELILKRKFGIQKPLFNDIKKFYDDFLSMEKIDLTDQKVYENSFHSEKWSNAIFQFTEEPVRNFCNSVKPRTIFELSAVTAIWRPGPLASKVHEIYLQAKLNPNSVQYDHPIIKEVLGNNFGNIIYQEDISMLTHKLGKDISLDDGNDIRKLLVKRGIDKGDKLDKYKSKFIQGCTEKGLSEEKAIALWQKMEYCSQYLFNYSHSFAYSVTSFQCAYLWTYFPTEWLLATLEFEKEENKQEAIGVVKSFGYEIKPVDINYSSDKWDAHQTEKIIFQPLTSLKGLGEKAIEQIVENRPFKTIEDLLFNEKIVYSKLNKKSLDVLTRAGALDSLIDKRFTGTKHFWSAVAVDRPKDLEQFQLNIEKYKPEGNFTSEEKLENLVSLSGNYPIELVMSEELMQDLKLKKIPSISNYDSFLHVCWGIPRAIEVKTTKNNKKYYVIELIDETNSLTRLKLWYMNEYRERIELNKPYLIKPTKDKFGFSIRNMSQFKLIG